MIKGPHAVEVSHLHQALSLWLQYPPNFIEGEHRIVLRKVLQDAVRKHPIKTLRSKRQIAAVRNHIFVIEAHRGTDATSCHDGAQGRIDADDRIALSCRRDRPATPIASYVEQRISTGNGQTNFRNWI